MLIAPSGFAVTGSAIESVNALAIIGPMHSHKCRGRAFAPPRRCIGAPPARYASRRQPLLRTTTTATATLHHVDVDVDVFGVDLASSINTREVDKG